MQVDLDISKEVKEALNYNKPVIALESSVIANGLPVSINIRTALELEEVVKENGGVPATIGIVDGKIKVGLSKEEIEKLGDGSAFKCSARDIAYSIVNKQTAGTTVSATARIANASGIFIMSTGGIGGVHKNFSSSLDISQDLWTMVRTPITIVCSGPKAVLDVDATAEWLETFGVPIYGLFTDELPAFYSSKSGVTIPKLESIDDLINILKVSRGELGNQCSIVVAVPIPKENELDINKEIEAATTEAQNNGVHGKELTPYLLSKLNEMTNGKSIEANIALLKNNAKIATEIALKTLCDKERRMGFLV